MNDGSFWLISVVAVPAFGAFLIPVLSAAFPKRGKILALLLGAFTFLSASKLLLAAAHGETFFYGLPLPLGLSLGFQSDALAAFMAFVSSSISLVIIYYSQGYIAAGRGETEYYTMVVLFLGAMMGLVFSANLVWLFVFWEITAICSWRLVGYFRGERDVLKADKTFLVTVFGALCLLLGIVIVYCSTGTADLKDLRGVSLPNAAVFLILLGIFSKSATLPFSTWLPDAGVAPSPVTALLHAAVLVKIGVYVFARLFCATTPLDPVWSLFTLYIAAASALISAGAALIETDIKRIIAYSTISQIGFIFLGLAVGGKIGIAGALLYILMHGFAKGGLFLCAGLIEHKAHTKDITKMGGLFSSMPITGTAFAFCALSVMGIPPFGGFFGKFMVLRAAASFGNPWILACFVATAVLTLMYLTRLFYAIFLGESRHVPAPGPEGAREMTISVSVLGLASLLLGIFIYSPAHYVDALCSGIGVILP